MKNKTKGWIAAGIMAVSLVTGWIGGILGHAASYNIVQSRKLAEISEFPESYRAGLTAVKNAIPNAQFIYFETGLDWYQDLLKSENEMLFGRNLVPKSSISSWKSAEEIPGSFDWVNNVYIEPERGWNQASKALIEYYMDPRNFLTETGIFQFEQLSYNSEVHTLEGVESILANSFMSATSGNYLEEIIPAEEEEPQESESEKESESESERESESESETEEENVIRYTYAEAFMKIGQELGVSPYLLAARVRQEQGTAGTNPLISGTYEGYEGYYNYFNINATGQTSEQIITNGLKEAVTEGWDTRYKAIYGGAKKLSKNYVASGKDTLYLQHFSVNAQGSSGTVYYYPYMTNILAPESESKNVYNSYKKGECLDSTFTFVIPVYRNMPETPQTKPTGDGNPNNRLKGLAVNDYGVDIGTFHIDTLSYSAVVPYAISRVKVSAAVFTGTSKVAINGTLCTNGSTDVSGDVDLKVGNNTIEVKVTAQNGAERIYTITVNRLEQPEEDKKEPTYSCDTAVLEEGTATGIRVGTTVKELMAGFTSDLCTPVLFRADGVVAEGTDLTATGQMIKIQAIDGSTLEEFEVIIKGDCSGDGVINVKDMLFLQRHIVSLQTMEGTAFTAIDLDSNNTLNVKDMLYLQRHIVGLAEISQ